MNKKSRKPQQDTFEGFLKEPLFLILIAVSALVAFICFRSFGGDNIRSDGCAYYQYFKRLFITHDLITEGMISYPMGTAILQLPFLLITLAYSVLTGFDVGEAMSLRFHATVSIAAFFYWTLSMAIIYRLLRKRYSSMISVLVCASISYGTMLAEYVIDMTSYSHIYGFFVCTLFFAYVSYYEEKREASKKKWLFDLALGTILGLAVVIRNTHIIMGAIYLLYGVTGWKSFIERLKKIISTRLILQIIGFMIFTGCQFILWRLMSGKWVLYSYEGQSFVYMFKPQVLRVLFSDAKGLFIFCPILLVAMISMIAFRKDNPDYRIGQWVVFIGVTYFVSAWWCWWLGTAYGERMHCDILCVFALPLASFYEHIKKSVIDGRGKKRKLQSSLAVMCAIVCVAFVILNMIWLSGCISRKISPNLATWYQLKEYISAFF